MRVRARVSPSGRPSYGDPGRTEISSLTSPSTCCRSAASRSITRVAPRISASASASSSVSRTWATQASGSRAS